MEQGAKVRVSGPSRSVLTLATGALVAVTSAATALVVLTSTGGVVPSDLSLAPRPPAAAPPARPPVVVLPPGALGTAIPELSGRTARTTVPATRGATPVTRSAAPARPGGSGEGSPTLLALAPAAGLLPPLSPAAAFTPLPVIGPPLAQQPAALDAPEDEPLVDSLSAPRAALMGPAVPVAADAGDTDRPGKKKAEDRGARGEAGRPAGPAVPAVPAAPGSTRAVPAVPPAAGPKAGGTKVGKQAAGKKKPAGAKAGKKAGSKKAGSKRPAEKQPGSTKTAGKKSSGKKSSGKRAGSKPAATNAKRSPRNQ